MARMLIISVGPALYKNISDTCPWGMYLASCHLRIQTGVLILQCRSDALIRRVDFRTYFPCQCSTVAESDYHAGHEGGISTASNVDLTMPTVPSAFTT